MSESAKVAPCLYWSIVPIHRVFMHLYFGKITIVGRENLPKTGPAVFASKHFSRWDSLILALLSTEPLRYMSRSDQMTGIQGWLLEHLGCFSVDP
ncbi:MAG: 1-acyl-sn-glycerol-3-phosphate acyltransferase, partial [Phormidesmis sp. CAN_BIN44]|nr:1-acyl-sn-glycerol-3-phosphate acyltransferase [Phormidesmis sp. CAN_BIN44]